MISRFLGSIGTPHPILDPPDATDSSTTPMLPRGSSCQVFWSQRPIEAWHGLYSTTKRKKERERELKLASLNEESRELLAISA
jgi:hypothetical protein